MTAGRKLIITEDGSNSIFNEDLGETYHSIHGAIQESEHVFIQAGLKHHFSTYDTHYVRIFELGFGTGLNALLSCRFAEKEKIHVDFTSVEAFPLEETEYSALNYPNLLPFAQSQQKFLKMHQCPFDKEISISRHFTLKKMAGKFEDILVKKGDFDLFLYDAFAPGKQPDIWSIDNLAKAYRMLKKYGILVTYCAQGQFRRNLQQVGFSVEKLPGPPGKNEMIRAVKIE